MNSQNVSSKELTFKFQKFRSQNMLKWFRVYINKLMQQGTLTSEAQYWRFMHGLALWKFLRNWFSYAIKTLITNWISLLQIGHEAPDFFNLLAHWKQANRWPIFPWTIFPSLGLFLHRLHNFNRFWQFSMFSMSVLWSKRLLDCSPMLDIVSWLSELWAKSKNFTELQGSESLGFPCFRDTSLGLTTGAEMVLRQSGTSIPSFSFLSSMAVISDVEREWVNLGQSEYQFFLKAQQLKQYLLLGELNFLHSVHCHSSYKDKCSLLPLTDDEYGAGRQGTHLGKLEVRFSTREVEPRIWYVL